MITPEEIKVAAACGSSPWIREFIAENIAAVIDCTISPTELEARLQTKFISRKLAELKQQKNYRSNVCKAIKTIDPNHPAIAIVSPTTGQYEALNDGQRQNLADRHTKYLTASQVDVLVATAANLLDSPNWYDVAAGIAVLTGRRISEILLGNYQLDSAWILKVSRLSKIIDKDLTIEVPTLIPAATVIAAIDKLQSELKIDDLIQNSNSDRQATQFVNERYSNAVLEACRTHYTGLVPPRTDKTDLYTHLFRAIYPTIASHWYCPPHIPVHQYKAEIQGHFTPRLTADGKRIHNYNSRANYDDYEIGLDGNKDGRLGIKLDTLPDFIQVSAFHPVTTTPKQLSPAAQRIVTAYAAILPKLTAATTATETELLLTATIKEQSEQSPSSKTLIKYQHLWHPSFTDPLPMPTNADEHVASTRVLNQPDVTPQTLNPFAKILELTQLLTTEIITLQLPPSLPDLQSENQLLRDRVANLSQQLQQSQSQLDAIRTAIGLPVLPLAPAPLSHPPLEANDLVIEALPKSQPVQYIAARPSAEENSTDHDIVDRLIELNNRNPDRPLPILRFTVITIDRIISAIIRWNDTQEKKIRISYTFIRILTHRLKVDHLPILSAIMLIREAEIESHHQHHRIGARANRWFNQLPLQDRDNLVDAIEQFTKT